MSHHQAPKKNALVLADDANAHKLCRVNALGFLMPLRKKLHLQLNATSLHLCAVETGVPEVVLPYEQVRAMLRGRLCVICGCIYIHL